jgi:hypothetical protein
MAITVPSVLPLRRNDRVLVVHISRTMMFDVTTASRTILIADCGCSTCPRRGKGPTSRRATVVASLLLVVGVGV